MKNFICNIAIQTVLVGAFYLWHFHGSATAGTFFVFVMWVLTGFLALAIFGPKPKRRAGLFKTIHGCIFGIIIVTALLWAGQTALAICYFVSWILLCAKFTDLEAA